MRQLTENKQFHIGDVLSVIAQRNLGPNGMEGVQNVLEYMTGDGVWTYQIGKAAEACTKPLLEMHPFLASIDTSHVTDANHQAWLHDIVNQHGNSLFLTPLQDGEYVREEIAYDQESGG